MILGGRIAEPPPIPITSTQLIPRTKSNFLAVVTHPKVVEVSLVGSIFGPWELDLKKWPGGGAIVDPIWEQSLQEQTPSKNEPAAWIKSNVLRVKIVIDALADLSSARSVKVRGVGISNHAGIDFKEKTVTFHEWPTNGIYMTGEVPIQSDMGAYNDMEVEWQYQVSGNPSWIPMNRTKLEKVFVIHSRDPNDNSKKSIRRLSMLQILPMVNLI